MFKKVLSLFLFFVPMIAWYVMSSSVSHAKQTSYVLGIDVSHFQGVVNWPQLDRQKFGFSIAKATGGITYVDPQFQANWHSLRAINLTRGAYHFFYADDDPVAQANHYLNTVRKFRSVDIPPILDVEITDNVSKEKLLLGVLEWLKTVKEATGRRPILYTDVSFANEFLTDTRLAEYTLWVADYTKSFEFLPGAWRGRDWSLWQYSDTGKVAGIDGAVDVDRFNGDNEKFAMFIRDSNIQKESPK